MEVLRTGSLKFCATLLHLPRVLIMESSIPFAAAVVVTPILKLYPLHFDWLIQASVMLLLLPIPATVLVGGAHP